jgi:hypothetical protein
MVIIFKDKFTPRGMWVPIPTPIRPSVLSIQIEILLYSSLEVFLKYCHCHGMCYSKQKTLGHIEISNLCKYGNNICFTYLFSNQGILDLTFHPTKVTVLYCQPKLLKRIKKISLQDL